MSRYNNDPCLEDEYDEIKAQEEAEDWAAEFYWERVLDERYGRE